MSHRLELATYSHSIDSVVRPVNLILSVVVIHLALLIECQLHSQQKCQYE